MEVTPNNGNGAPRRKGKPAPPLGSKKPPVNTTGHAIRTPDGKVIRNGDRVPFKKASDAVKEDRIDQLVDFMASKPKISGYAVATWCMEQWDIRRCQATNYYIKRARSRLRRMVNMTPAEVSETVRGFYLDTIRNGTRKEGLIACKNLSEIAGIVVHLVTTPANRPMETREVRPLKDVPPERLRELALGFGRNGNGNSYTEEAGG